MKTKMIIGTILGALLLFLAIGFYNASQLRTIEITRSVSITASPETVYDMISRLNNYPKWSPFLAQDPSQKYHVEGTDGTVGAQYHWEGNNGKDLGYQQIVKLEPNRFVGMRCDIQKPFQAQPTFDYIIEGSNGKTEVTQHFTLESELADAFFLWLFGVKKSMGATNQQGLDLLKEVAES